ncbi:MAG: L,D-transpeptidase family protein, partial [Ferruginibacter sp.]
IAIVFFGLTVTISFCNNKKEDIVPASAVNVGVEKVLISMFDSLVENTINDSTFLFAPKVLLHFYNITSFKPIWSSARNWNPITDSLMLFLKKGHYLGLIKEDYQYDLLLQIKKQLDNDSLKISSPSNWARAEVLFTDALVHIFEDVKQGRLQNDSLNWVNNSDKWHKFFIPNIQQFVVDKNLNKIISTLEPSHQQYMALKNALATFAGSMEIKKYTYIQYPYKDSIYFIKKLKQRMAQEGFLPNANVALDSAGLTALILQYQKTKELKATGKISSGLVNMLNSNDLEKFYRVAITLDKFKKMLDTFPKNYILINLPSYQLNVWDEDSIVLQSKIIIGKTSTPTPHITSAISNLVIYPTWTVPKSIIASELLPGLKRNAGYLSKKGLGLYTYKGEPVDPYGIDWTQYSNNIPYLVRQNSGQNNALGVIKFNFNNPHDVYLHDTNQRYLFNNNYRSLSHGCVRVQQWQKLAFYIA